MGFFKDIHQLNKMGKEASKNWDPGAQLANAQASMARANADMAAVAARASSTAALHGTPGAATVTAARTTGQYVNMQPMVALDLLVQVPGRIPMPVSVTELVDQVHLGRLLPGATLAVKVGDRPDDLFIDWYGTV
jgi:hypothetical protein